MNETFICVAGDNIVYYDVGFLDANGVFVPTALAAFSQIVTVLRGSPSKFTLSCIQRMTEKTFLSILSYLVVVVLDSGSNVNHSKQIKFHFMYMANSFSER